MHPDLTPYVTRVVHEWLRGSPEVTWREIDGTLVFVDISGFTAMSERLAKKGKVGAEEVTDVINETFAELLKVAYEVGGSLLKFGGDALLLFFMGENHVTRACHAAGHMRTTLKKMGPITTSAGKIRLEMSAGIHSGGFHFFLVGKSHRELIITSPHSSKTVDMEAAAGPGEILVSEETAAQLDEECLGSRKNGGRLLVSPCAALRRPIEPAPVSEGAEVLLPEAIRRHILGGGEEAEHRQVTVAFIHFGGTDEFCRIYATDEVTSRLSDLVTSVQAAVEENNICFLATDIDRNGGKIILTAGAPHATGNDEERMLRALRSICHHSTGLELRIGVHRGRVFAGVVGPFYRRTYTVMGDAVNTAARVMSRAEAGQILATKEVVERSATLFKLQELEPFKVKGKADPIVAFGVGRVVGQRREPVTSDLPLIGRSEELDRLRSALESAERGQGRLVEIVGEGGLGKSRLIQELRSKAAGFVAITAQCEQYEASTPYYPFRALLRSAIQAEGAGEPAEIERMLRAAVDSAAPELEPWIPLIGIALDLEIPPTPEVGQLDEQFAAARMRSSVTALLSALLAEPTLLVFEDAHWMDQPSRELLEGLVQEVEKFPWAVYVTTRPGHPEIAPAAAALRIRLDPLPPDDSVALARAASDDSLLPQQAEVLARRGGGHPLFLQALVAATRGTTDLGELPETIESAVSAQIDELTPADRTFLRYMAVLGREIDLQLLPEVIEETDRRTIEQVLPRLSTFVQVDDGRATFRQALIRDAAYEGLSYRRRRAIHERIGRLIEERATDPDKEAELLALHFDKAERFEESWHYSRIAVERAWRKFAPNNVIDFSRKAIAAGRRIKRPKTEMASIFRELGFGSFKIGQYQEASQAFAKIRPLTGDVGMLAWLFFMQGRCRDLLGNRAQAIRWFRRGLRFLEAQAPLGESEEPLTSPPPDYVPVPPRVRLIAAQAHVRREQGLFKQAVDLAHQAAAVAEAVEDRYGLALGYNLLQIVYTDLRDPARRKYGEMALEIAEEVGNRYLEASILNNLAVDAYWEGDWTRSLALYERSRDGFVSAGDDILSAAVSNNIAEILSDQGRLEEAERLFLDSLSTFRAARYELHAATLTANLGRLAGRAGRFEDAERLLSEAIASLTGMGYPSEETEARRVEVMLLKGDFAPALRALESIKPGDDPILGSMLHRLRGWALAQAGRPGEAAGSFGTALELARAAGAGYEEGLTLEALASTTDPEARHRYRAEADEILRRLGVASVPRGPLPSGPRPADL